MGEYLNEKANLSKDSWVSQMLRSHQEAGSSKLKVLELGSGTGLGGISTAKILENQKSDLTSPPELYLTDICTKSLDTVRNNLTLANNLSKPERITLVPLEWGKHDDDFAREHAGTFDLIIASDVVYLPECVDPLFKTIAHFLKPGTGRSLLVNCLVRTGPFLE